ncbi:MULTISPECIES: metalloregulator ArsR/SmtB family transcription factor [unclassified Dyella]|uniref:ArsR/SmtB family transcription factor n=1 Tax=unclassified Dyella TaxID=2634549 RepID=UPI0018EAF2B9|nr:MULTISPECIES: metalloregulator ArsR/SmtB family transcription factor [unclassified Dyella]
MQTKQAITVLSALAQESRLAVYRLLVEHAPDGLAASVIAERLGLANATLSFHLKELVHAGLITSRQESRFIYYSPILEVMNELVGYLTENCCCATGQSCTPASAPKSVANTARPRKRTA